MSDMLSLIHMQKTVYSVMALCGYIVVHRFTDNWEHYNSCTYNRKGDTRLPLTTVGVN